MNYKFIQNKLLLIKAEKENTVTVEKDFIISMMEEVLATRRKNIASRKRSGSKHPNASKNLKAKADTASKGE